MQQRMTTKLRELLRQKTFLHMPSVYDALGGRLVQSIGYEAAYIGGYVTGGSMAVTEPLLTMTEQVRLSADIAQSIDIPLIADAGAGFGEPLHTMRTVREFKQVLTELRETGDFKGMTDAQWVASRQQVEDLIDLTKYYEIEAQTVETRKKN